MSDLKKVREELEKLKKDMAAKKAELKREEARPIIEGFRNKEEFGYMAGYEPWEKLIFDR